MFVESSKRSGPTPDDLPPRFHEEVDLAAYIRACPREATTRGAFFQRVHEATSAAVVGDRERLFEGLDRRSWFPFQSYPLTEFMRLSHNAAVVSFGSFGSAEGLRRIGWMAYPSFASTMAGRVVIFALGNTLDDIVAVVPQAYKHTLPLASVDVTRKGESHYEIVMRDVHSFVDTYHCGVLEGALVAHGRRPSVSVQRLARRCDARFIVRWQ